MKATSFLRLAKRILKSKNLFAAAFLVLVIFSGISGCSYYKVKKSDLNNPPSSQELQKLSPEERYVIIHSGNQRMHLNKVRLDEDRKLLSGELTQLDPQHVNKTPVHKKTYRYKRTEKNPLNEVHFYTSKNLDLRVGEEVAIPFSILDSVSVNNPNTGRSVINVVGTTVGVLAVGIAVIALTKSSCPFIYIKDGEEFVFTGELYPGAITPNLQRDDYIPLPGFKPVGEDYIIRITNELHEVQHTDLAHLIVVNHPEDVKVVLDDEGRPHSLSDIQEPKKAFSEDLTESLTHVQRQNNKVYMFDSESQSTDGSRSMTMEFTRPAGAGQAKLFLTAKNSFWLDYAFGKFNEKFGSYYSTFQKQQLTAPGEESRQWAIDQHIPLSIYLKTKEGWQLVKRINSVGPLAYRDIVVPFNLKYVQGENVVLKFETGFMFWEIDRAGIDFSKNIDLEPIVVEPSYAVDEKGNNVTSLLLKNDGKYLIQPEVGNAVTVTYTYSSKDESKTTLFLKNRGYYTYIRKYSGMPDVAELRSFKKKGRFSQFSKEQYDRFIQEEMLDLALTYGN